MVHQALWDIGDIDRPDLCIKIFRIQALVRTKSRWINGIGEGYGEEDLDAQ